MIIQCDQCQKKYKIDPARIKGGRAVYACKSCGGRITVSLEAGEDKKEPRPSPLAASSFKEQAADSRPEPQPQPADKREKQPSSKNKAPAGKKRRFGLNAKMLLLFFLIPLCLVATASGIYLWQLQSLTNRIIGDSYRIIERFSHNLVNDTARMVANQCRLYLEAHPDMQREEFNQDPEFRALALQKVGQTGYTCLYSIPDAEGKSALWIHPNEKIIGTDLPPAMKKAMGPKYHDWMKIYKGAYNGKPSSGYYKWKEKNGAIREKYMTCMPIEGTPYVVAATTYVDEIKSNAEKLRATAETMTRRTEKVILGVLAITLLLMGGIVLFYSNRLKSNLKTLIDAAEKISIGDLDTEIMVRSRDEISDLAETISRMQESIRLSIQRLRRRR